MPVTLWSPRVLTIWLALVTVRSERARARRGCARRRLLSLLPIQKKRLLGWWLGGFCKVFGCIIVECSSPDRIHTHTETDVRLRCFFKSGKHLAVDTVVCKFFIHAIRCYDCDSLWRNRGYKMVQRPGETDEETRKRHVKLAGALAALLLRLANQRVEKLRSWVLRVSETVSVREW